MHSVTLYHSLVRKNERERERQQESVVSVIKINSVRYFFVTREQLSELICILHNFCSLLPVYFVSQHVALSLGNFLQRQRKRERDVHLLVYLSVIHQNKCLLQMSVSFFLMTHW